MALYVVTGPPAGGKSTWVRQRARPGDIVVDLDDLANALTAGPETHQHTKPVLRCAQRARSVAVDEALRHTARTDVYVIHTLPSPQVMARYRQRGARVVTCDPGRDVVEARVREARPPGTLAVVGRWYAQATAPPGITHRDDDQGPVIHTRAW